MPTVFKPRGLCCLSVYLPLTICTATSLTRNQLLPHVFNFCRRSTIEAGKARLEDECLDGRTRRLSCFAGSRFRSPSSPLVDGKNLYEDISIAWIFFPPMEKMMKIELSCEKSFKISDQILHSPSILELHSACRH